MDFPKVHGRSVLVLTLACLSAIKACNVARVRGCKGYNTFISKPDFHAFLQEDTLDEVCSGFQTALGCAYQYLQNCPIYVTLPFDSQKGVIDVVCGEKRKAYLESVSCFNKNNLKARISENCMKALTRPSNPMDKCSVFTWVSDCARTTTMTSDGCSTSDAALMKELADIYQQPTAKIYGCRPPEVAVSDSPEASKTHPFITSEAVNTPEMTPTSDKTDEKSSKPTSANDSTDDNTNLYTTESFAAMSRGNRSTQTSLHSTSEESDTEEGSSRSLYAAFRASSRSKSKGSSNTSKSSSKNSKKTSNSSKIKGTTSSSFRQTSSASNSKLATTMKPNSRQSTTSKSKSQTKATDTSGKRKSGSADIDTRDDSSSNTAGEQGAVVHTGAGDKNKAALRVSCVTWVFITSLVSVVYSSL